MWKYVILYMSYIMAEYRCNYMKYGIFYISQTKNQASLFHIKIPIFLYAIYENLGRDISYMNM